MRDVRELLWFMQVGQRPWRELYWLGLMPDTHVTSLGSPTPPDAQTHLSSSYLQPTKRFIEAGAMAWLRDVRQAPTDVDWVASLEPFSLVTGQAARFARKHDRPLSVVMWHNFAETPLYRIPFYKDAWKASRHAQFFLCLIEASRRHIVEDMGVDPSLVECVLPGIDTTVFTPPEQPVEEPVVAFIAPLRNNKGLDHVLLAFDIVKREVPDARLVIAGTGEDEAMARAAAEADPRHVEYVGMLDQAGVADLMKRSAVYVTAPRATRMWNEQFGLAYLEAMASGMVVVTTASGTNDEAVKSPNFRLEDDVDLIAGTIVDLLRDPTHRATIARANREWVVAEHDVRTQAARMGEAYARAEARLGLR